MKTALSSAHTIVQVYQHCCVSSLLSVQQAASQYQSHPQLRHQLAAFSENNHPYTNLLCDLRSFRLAVSSSFARKLFVKDTACKTESLGSSISALDDYIVELLLERGEHGRTRVDACGLPCPLGILSTHVAAVQQLILPQAHANTTHNQGSQRTLVLSQNLQWHIFIFFTEYFTYFFFFVGIWFGMVRHQTSLSVLLSKTK